MKTKKLTRKSLLIGTAAVITVACLAVLLLRAFPEKSVAVNTGSDGINYGPPSKTELKEAEQNKQAAEQRQSIENSQGGDSRLRSVQPVIVDANQYGDTVEVSAYVSGVIEDGGTCNLLLESGSQKISRTVNGVKDATTTRCPIFSIGRAQISSAGQWKATVNYKSASAEGTSQTRTFEVN